MLVNRAFDTYLVDFSHLIYDWTTLLLKEGIESQRNHSHMSMCRLLCMYWLKFGRDRYNYVASSPRSPLAMNPTFVSLGKGQNSTQGEGSYMYFCSLEALQIKGATRANLILPCNQGDI